MKDASLSDVQQECNCGRYHSASEFTYYKCGKLVPVKNYQIMNIDSQKFAYVVGITEIESIGLEIARKIEINRQENVYAKLIWNEAIEAAAKLTGGSGYVADEIRKLKK